MSCLGSGARIVAMLMRSQVSNDPKTLAVYGGIFKGVAAAGLAVAFGLSAGAVTTINISIIMFVLQIVA